MREVVRAMLVLLVMYPASAQDRSHPPGGCRLESKYDEMADTTTVKCMDLVKWGEAPSRLTIHAAASFTGREPNQSVRLWLLLSSNRSGSTREAPLLFKEAATIHLAFDSDQLDIPVTDFVTDFFELTHLRAESAHATISLEDLQRLLKAKSVAGRWGAVDFRFSDSELACLKNFIAHEAIEPLAHYAHEPH
jgi:hypothetical protein